MGAGALHESDFNAALAEVLADQSAQLRAELDVFGERVGLLDGSKKADVLVLGSSRAGARLPIACECEYQPHNPDGDSRARLGDVVTATGEQIAAAVAISVPAAARDWASPQAARHELRMGARLEYAVWRRAIDESGKRVIARWPTQGWISGDVAALSELIVALTVPLEHATALAHRAADMIDSISDTLDKRLSPAAKHELAVVLGRPGELDSLRVLGLVLLDAFLFQDRIAVHHPSVPFRADMYDKQTLQLLLSKVREAWAEILKIDYRPVFGPADDAVSDVLIGELPAAAIAELLQPLEKQAEMIATSALALFDAGRELFQHIISDRDDSAAYYTRPEVAWFLGHLVVRHRWTSLLPPPPPTISLRQRVCASATLRAVRGHSFERSTATCARCVDVRVGATTI